ncbi:MAG: PAS domain S-box protein, partial [Rivularia sp. ALOHA_DT_140]|nr:PAS domain S-box protein [Rivularia sp. ALOHA_DT_140]
MATPNGFFKRINPAFTKILGYTQEELLNQPFLNFIHPEDVEPTLKEVQRLTQGNESVGFENRYRCRDGTYRWLQWTSTFYQGLIYASARDLTEQKLAQELQNRQLAAIETANDGIAILNDDKFIYLNQAHLGIFGYSQPEELIGQSWHILYEPEELARFEREVFPILFERGKWQGEALAKHRDGHTFNEELTLAFTTSGDLICTCRDITEIKQAQKQILQANIELEQRVAQRTESLANFSNCLQQIHRLAISNYQNLDDLFTNYLQVGCQMFNLATGIVSKVNNSNYYIVAVESPLDLEVGYKSPCVCNYCEEVVENLSTVIFNGLEDSKLIKNIPGCFDLKLESLIITPIFVNSNLYGAFIFCDTTPRESEFTEEEIKIIELMAKDIGNSIASVETEAALRKNEKLFRSTFEQAAIGIAHLNPEGCFLRVNQGFCDILGYSEAELLQKGFVDITDPEDLAPDLEYVRQMLAGEIDNYSREKRYIHSNGSIVWANLTVSLVKQDSGEAEYFVAIVKNISVRKQAEIDLKESKSKLQKANQAKDAFIAHMSHELRTPLNSILGFSSILQKDSDLTTQQLHSIKIINQSGQHLLILINDILDLSKITANKLQLEPRVFNFIQFLNEIATIFRLRAQQKDLKFSTSISPSLPKIVNADETRLRQVLLNLLGNAVKFTPNGTITFKVSNIKKQTKKLLKPETTQKIRFQIEDTGIGIPNTKLTEVFLPFTQLGNITENLEGTGLGLNISQNIIQLMGSQIQLKSKVGQGSKFWFDLEILEADANILPISSKPNYQNIRCLREPQKILIVDDRDDNRALLVSYLERLGFIIAEANNGETGLAT